MSEFENSLPKGIKEVTGSKVLAENTFPKDVHNAVIEAVSGLRGMNLNAESSSSIHSASNKNGHNR